MSLGDKMNIEENRIYSSGDGTAAALPDVSVQTNPISVHNEGIGTGFNVNSVIDAARGKFLALTGAGATQETSVDSAQAESFGVEYSPQVSIFDGYTNSDPILAEHQGKKFHNMC